MHPEHSITQNAEMESGSSRAIFTGEEVLPLLNTEGEDGGMEDLFFPGCDEEFGMQEEECEMYRSTSE